MGDPFGYGGFRGGGEVTNEQIGKKKKMEKSDFFD